MPRYLTIGLLLFASADTQSADWPQWRGPTRDCRISTPAEWPDSLSAEHLTRSWRISLGPGYSGPIVSGPRVFVTETLSKTDEVVRALDRRTGKQLWKAEWQGSLNVPFFARENGSWIRSTPASDGQNLYVAGIRDVLVSLNAETGHENWRVDFVKTFNAAVPGFGTVCSPLPDGEFIYLQAAASVLKLNKSDGKIIWRSTPESGGLLGSGMSTSAFSSPVMATIAGHRQLVVQSRKSLFGLDLKTGQRLWSRNVKAFRGMNILTPTVVGNTVFTSTYGGGTFLYEVTRSDSGFQVKEAWNTSKQGYMSSPAVINGRVFLHLRNRRLTCINPANGETNWTTRPFGKYWSMVSNGKRLLALDQNGELRLIDASPDEYRELSRRRISESETWGHLAAADRQLFVRELNALTVWKWQ
ncbi:MAG: PQQ-binding-like beta-propeller repeat protein [Fuerstiella sp.]|nr:PQQ-binding-like beta-propeller repeat protein [Fuerstiella sp.]